MAEEFVTVTTAQGVILGKKEPCKAGGRFYTFKGIPYAKPPIGPLRFKDPQPPDTWQCVRRALEGGKMCTQYDIVHDSGFMGSEDCLYLNVYAPESASINADGPKLPVMVWIHGGGFAVDCGDYERYGGDYLVAENVVLVTINYRLGPFGFLYLAHEAAPGNYGLKDQTAALKWVQQNIAAFGGDPNNVTIFGESAGGSSVHYHMLSPLSKGLFHKAIAQSGAVFSSWAVAYKPEEMTRRLARALGCSKEDPEDIVAFLRGIDHIKLLKAAMEEAPLEREKKRLLFFSFVPTEEVPAPDAQRFLPSTIDELVNEGKHHPVPYLTGTTEHEGLLLYALGNFKSSSLEELDGNWEERVLPEARLPIDPARASDAVAELRNFFLGGETLTEEAVPKYLDMYADLHFCEGIDHVVRQMARDAKAPLYYYQFTVDGELNWLKKECKVNKPGASHADENGYLFRKEFEPDLPSDHPSTIARKRILRLWTNFARTGNPTPEDDPLLGVRWEQYTTSGKQYLEIGDQLQMKSDLYKERMAFWDDFYTKYKQ